MLALSSVVSSSIFRKMLVIVAVFTIAACAKTSPQFETAMLTAADGKSAQEIFDASFIRHGGKYLGQLNDVNVAVDGDWYYLITKIQPEVTDEAYRQQSQERILLSPNIYAVEYTGEAGTKHVYRSRQNIAIAYNGEQSNNLRKETASALTADAFYLFTLGPLALNKQVNTWQRLEDANEKGNSYYRINGELKPGIGRSESDFITLWIDKQSNLTYRMHITLEGFDTTKGAHVDTTFLNYKQVAQFTLPTHFFERVIGPIRLDAHEWWYTGMDINRGLKPKDVELLQWSNKARAPAKPINGKKD